MDPIAEITATLKRMEGEIHTIKRGVYGDEPNGVLGLIDTDKSQDLRIKAIEDKDNKRVWMGVGALAIIEMIIQVIKLQ